MEKKIRKKTSSLDEHYKQYIETGNKDQFLTGLYRETYAYCIRRLSSDPDIVGDFFVYLLEGKIDQIVEEFQRREHPSFPAFYILCMRNMFYNFIRKHRRRELSTLPLLTDPSSERVSTTLNPNEFWQKLELGLRHITDIDSLLFKIYYSIPLNADNLKAMVRHFGIGRTQEIMEQISEKRRLRDSQLIRAEARMSRFYRRTLQTTDRLRSGRRDADVQSYLNRHWAHSIYNVATLLGISRQLAAFRLRRTMKFLRRFLSPVAVYEL